MEVLMKVEFREIKSLLSPKNRNLLRAKGKMRTLAILEASLRGEKQHPSDAGLNRMLKDVKKTKDWRTVFPGISTLQLDTSDSGLAVHIRVTKNEGQAVHLVPEVSAVGQNQPAVVEIRGFKTSHFLERKTSPVSGPSGARLGDVQCPQSEPARIHLQFKRPAVVPAAHRARVEDRPGNGWAVLADPVKPGHFDRRRWWSV
jgi:hypothetical protein